jgi:hypothetical protein
MSKGYLEAFFRTLNGAFRLSKLFLETRSKIGKTRWFPLFTPLDSDLWLKKHQALQRQPQLKLMTSLRFLRASVTARHGTSSLSGRPQT